jgi:beta-N-acetylhexosaminidase
MAYLGHLDDVAVTERAGRGIGRELAAAGIDLNLAPVADVNSDPRNPVIGIRSFGSDAALAARHVAAYTRGLQSAGVGAVAKHFPGHGDTATDSHLDQPTIAVTPEVLAAREFVPFGAAIATGTLAVMTSHILVPAVDPALPATLSPAVLRLLREQLGFTGVIVSDALDMAGASGGRGIPAAAALALAAGVDLLCIGTDNTAGQLDEIRDHVLAAIHEGRLSEARVRDAASRVAALSARVAALRDARTPAGAGRTGSPATLPEERSEERGSRHEGADPDLRAGPPPLSPAGFWLRAPVRPVVAPLFLRLASADNIAAGDTVWGVSDHLAAELHRRLPGARCATAHDLADVAAVLDAAAGRALVVQGRDLARVDFLRAATAMVLQRRPDAVVVELGWPDPTVRFDIATYGSGRGAATCLIELLAEGTR